MGRILAIDFGLKRTGIAVTDPLKIIATPLETVYTEKFLVWLQSYITREDVEHVVVGLPTKPDQSETHTTRPVENFILQLKKQFPELTVSLEDERFTSKIAKQSMILGGMKKRDRMKKENVDKISATIILQSFLDKNRS